MRRELCPDCAKDQVGVPYNIVYDKNNKIVWSGYRSYQKVGDSLVGDDFITKIIRPAM